MVQLHCQPWRLIVDVLLASRVAGKVVLQMLNKVTRELLVVRSVTLNVHLQIDNVSRIERYLLWVL